MDDLPLNDSHGRFATTHWTFHPFSNNRNKFLEGNMKVRCPKGLTATPPNQQGWVNRTEKEKFVIDK